MINKIEGPGSIRSAQPVKKASKAGSTGGSGFSKALDDVGEYESAQGMSGAGAVSGIIGVQEVDDALHHASRGKVRAEDILDRLEDLRLQLLAGGLSKEKLIQLSRIVNARRAQVTDPRLAQILDEIDLRAQVEIAKHSVSNF